MTTTQGRVSDEEAMVRAAVANLADRYPVHVHEIEATVRRLVAEWLERARVKTFVGVIAERHARMELQQIPVRTQPLAGGRHAR